MANENVVKVIPTNQQLLTSKGRVLCPEDGCSKTFAHNGALRMHTVKSHGLIKVCTHLQPDLYSFLCFWSNHRQKLNLTQTGHIIPTFNLSKSNRHHQVYTMIWPTKNNILHKKKKIRTTFNKVKPRSELKHISSNALKSRSPLIRDHFCSPSRLAKLLHNSMWITSHLITNIIRIYLLLFRSMLTFFSTHVTIKPFGPTRLKLDVTKFNGNNLTFLKTEVWTIWPICGRFDL